MKTVGVIGAGLMGSGIAHVAAMAGHRVLLADVDHARAEAGRAAAERNMARQVGKGALETADASAALARIDPQGDTARFEEADIVIEAATEREAVKRAIFEGVAPRPGHDPRVQHILHLDHPAWRPRPTVPKSSSAFTSLTPSP